MRCAKFALSPCTLVNECPYYAYINSILYVSSCRGDNFVVSRLGRKDGKIHPGLHSDEYDI